MILNITSRDNSLLRRVRAVRDGKLEGLIYIEGLRLCEEALRSGLEIDSVIFSEEIEKKERAAAVIAELGGVCNRLASVSEKLLETISYTKTPQGIVALAKRPTSGRARLEETKAQQPLIVILHGINNPVNVGAILRTAEAAGATGAITTHHTSDPFSPKSLRGAMGSAFRLPIWTEVAYEDVLSWCGKHEIRTVGADAQANCLYTEIDWRDPRALIVGPEATGLTEEEIEGADEAVRIPMQGSVESLNVGVAAAIVLYEAARQREQRDAVSSPL
ncbi:MAG TPA: RNA methyltransferase [Pyrinomonadaceae bacterium]|nr:RNA methyltransferase [Pyrinomonadaceae bacterium]